MNEEDPEEKESRTRRESTSDVQSPEAVRTHARAATRRPRTHAHMHARTRAHENSFELDCEISEI